MVHSASVGIGRLPAVPRRLCPTNAAEAAVADERDTNTACAESLRTHRVRRSTAAPAASDGSHAGAYSLTMVALPVLILHPLPVHRANSPIHDHDERDLA